MEECSLNYSGIKMRLQKQLSRRKENKEYVKWVIVIPPSKVEELGWKEGVELKEDVKGGKLIIQPRKHKMAS